MTTELLRSSFDVDGTRVELLWDEQRFRFTVATRWINLAHLGCSLPTDGNKALALAQASATFEAVCMDGATRGSAQNAKKAAQSIHPARCISPSGYEREVLRRSAKPSTS
ncbi:MULTISPECIES: hypothetical protein [Ralstonia]|jgi:hypothetical protein|uniref:Uncharacterized protein n=2 Tax=Ralstonia pickettii TaxID=329 RepID=R0CMR3_RALPI|nr:MULTISPECIES: hypothetical protein [Ralstonia]ENZ77961.1 hypothetical protein OR214_02237 [Ralstonia pickettii OR214]MCM3581945.1 hypothetical protein [Ralstonia pickettii]